jgi:hypothetical protein
MMMFIRRDNKVINLSQFRSWVIMSNPHRIVFLHDRQEPILEVEALIFSSEAKAREAYERIWSALAQRRCVLDLAQEEESASGSARDAERSMVGDSKEWASSWSEQ